MAIRLPSNSIAQDIVNWIKGANSSGSGSSSGGGRHETPGTLALPNKFGDKPINTSYMIGNTEYPVYKSGSSYYILQNEYGNAVKKYIFNTSVIDQFKENKTTCVIGNNKDLVNQGPGVTYNEPAKQEETRQVETQPQQIDTGSGGGGGGGYTPSTPYFDTSRWEKQIADLQAELAELKRPRSAKELAEIYGLTEQYNEDNILRNYNEKTNAYYDAAVREQENLRNSYARNNAQYVDQITNAYLDSYKNAAPTATGRGTLAANALSTQLNADKINSSNDYGMMQSVNNLEEARKAELAGNPDLARQYYNSIGTYLSTLSATLNQSDVKQYVDQLDAYSSNYAADRSYQAYLAQANAAKYAGLANASATNASSTAGGYSNNAWQQLYNYYMATNNNNSKLADKYVANDLRSSTGAGNS